MEEASVDYGKAVEILESIEAEKGEEKQVLIKASDALASEISLKSYDYDKALATIGEGFFVKPEVVPTPVVPQPPIVTQKPKSEAVAMETAREMKQMAGPAARGFEGVKSKEVTPPGREKLILPTLSLQDQVHELEGINEGLGLNAFDDDHLRVVRYEISGLSNLVKGERTTTTDDFQRSLIELRNRRLSEVSGRLKG